MPKSIRIKATPQQDKNIQVKLEQDFDLLEILSLKIVKSEVYTRMCADYGVIVGRALANSGFGLPNAKISVFIPISEEDENNPIIKELYPYKDVNDKNEKGYRYNLLPKESTSCNHNATGNFYSAEEVINNPIVLEVFEKYYKYTTKTNESGDYMLWGIPLGTQTIHTSVDVSDIGCYSLRPYNFIAQGRSPQEFKNSLEFKTSNDLDALPQIVIQNKVAQVIPFWGDDELCSVGITRLDFDLRDSGIEILPTATFMGSSITDNDENYVEIEGTPSKYQGQMCGLTTGSGRIESVRHTIHTEEDGCTPKLEYFTLEQGGQVIDSAGAWVTQLPMNLDFIITNEYGNQVLSADPTIGIPTKAKYRFRISFDTPGTSIRNASYLIPNLREYVDDSVPAIPYTNPLTNETYTSPSYVFSNKLLDYPLDSQGSWENSPAYKCEDYFYEFTPNRVYTVASFIDNYRKHVGETQHVRGESNGRWQFLGIKGINPPIQEGCKDVTQSFPSNDVFRGGDMLFTQNQINRVTQLVTVIFAALSTVMVVILMLYQFWTACKISSDEMTIATFNAPAFALSLMLASWIVQFIFNILAGTFIVWPTIVLLLKNFKVVKRVFNYPTCEPCNCGAPYEFVPPMIWGGGSETVQEASGDDLESVLGGGEREPGNCQMPGFKDNAKFWRGRNWLDIDWAGLFNPQSDFFNFRPIYPAGCYVLTWGKNVAVSVAATLIVWTGVSFIPSPGGPIILGAFGIGLLIGWLLGMVGTVLDMFRSLNQWRVLANIYAGLCRGVFNMKFSNNWVNGTLYHFKFNKKTTTTDFYPDRVIWKQTDKDGKINYYYRSCPFQLTQGFISQNPNIDNDTNWPLNVASYWESSQGSGQTSEVDDLALATIEHCGINFPTTIMDLGVLDTCQAELCGEEKEVCRPIESVPPTSHQASEELLGLIITNKVARWNFSQFYWSGINKWFGGGFKPGQPYTRNTANRRKGSMGAPWYRGRVIDGDIAQLIATNNMAGISVFTSDIADPFYGRQNGQAQFYTDFLQTGVDQDGTAKVVKSIFKSSSRFPLIVENQDLINCSMGAAFGLPNTQVVPYYPWKKSNNPLYGDFNNGYNFGASPNVGCTQLPAQGKLEVIGYQQGLATFLPASTEPEGNYDGDWSTPAYYGPPIASPPPQFNFTSLARIRASGVYAPTPAADTRLGTSLFFYFGLRQGASAYDKFNAQFLNTTDD